VFLAVGTLDMSLSGADVDMDGPDIFLPAALSHGAIDTVAVASEGRGADSTTSEQSLSMSPPFEWSILNSICGVNLRVPLSQNSSL
jgi:hypothetical protein